MSLTIRIPDETEAALLVKAQAEGLSVEEYVLRVLGQDLAPEWLRNSWSTARDVGLDQLPDAEIDAEIAAARRERKQH